MDELELTRPWLISWALMGQYLPPKAMVILTVVLQAERQLYVKERPDQQRNEHTESVKAGETTI